MHAVNPGVDPAPISSLDEYLHARKQLIASREVLFTAARTYLRPGQRPDARQLGDRLWNSRAREISDEEWVVNAVRGYITVLESAEKGRGFRLCVLQQGYELRIGLRLPATTAPKLLARLRLTFGAHSPVTTEMAPEGLLLDWHFSAAQLYTQAQAIEDALYRISAVFEAALQTFNSLDKDAS
jgi:hypothetical protein